MDLLTRPRASGELCTFDTVPSLGFIWAHPPYTFSAPQGTVPFLQEALPDPSQFLQPPGLSYLLGMLVYPRHKSERFWPASAHRL